VASEPDWDNPCDAFVELRRAYMRLLTGKSAESVHYLANGVTRITQFTRINIEKLKVEMERARADCEALTAGAGKPRRFAITAGSRRQR
jgi:hypothetical protein